MTTADHTVVSLLAGREGRFRLVASDLDGTLLGPDGQPTPRTMAAIGDATAAGIRVVAATGRQVPQLPPSVLACPIRYAVGSNGAICVDLATDEVLFTELLGPEVLSAVVAELTSRVDGVRFRAVRDHGRYHAVEPGYFDLLTPQEKAAWPVEVEQLSSLIEQPTLKLSARHPELAPEALLEALATSGLSGFHATTSGASFVEIGPAEVTKATGVSRLCAILGVDAAEVAAFGDANNDVELLTWAGLGVAMGNAVPEAIAAADLRTATNDADGFARILELLLR